MGTRRVIVVLRDKPADKVEELRTAMEIRDDQMKDSDPESVFGWIVCDRVPTGVDVAMKDQLEAYKRDAGENACYMVVYG